MADVAQLKVSSVQVLALSCFAVAAGVWIKKKVPWLDRLNVPAAVIGGLGFALVALALRGRVAQFELDLVLRDVLMVTFFTTLGMGASLRLLKRGGVQVVLFLLLATVGAVLQNAVGIGLAKILGLDPLLGVVTGSVALTGGPATALAFGATFEKLGVTGATSVGVASAMFGITAGGLLGGWIGGTLIKRGALRSPGTDGRADETSPVDTTDCGEPGAEDGPAFQAVVAIAVSMGVGTLVSAAVERAGVVLPGYVGAMLCAAILRNANDRLRFFRLSERHVEGVGNVALSIFIAMALLNLKLWELANLALPMVIMLAVQVLLVVGLCVATFRVMGRDYEAAVMAGGFCGFMLGTTANAMACMGVLTARHGPAPRAFIVVPLVGAFLIDFTNALLITGTANVLR